MNQSLHDNNISALIDTNDGDAYLKNFRKHLGDVPARVIDGYHRSVRRGAELANQHTSIPVTQYLDEAFMILASFAEIGRSADNAAHNSEPISEERTRINAMLMAVLTLLYGYNMRIAKEAFSKIADEYCKDHEVGSDKLTMAMLVFLTENKHRLTEDAHIVHDMINVMSKKVYDECVEGLRHDVC